MSAILVFRLCGIYTPAMEEVVDSLRTQISGQVHELSRNKKKDTGETQGNSSLPMRGKKKHIFRSERNTTSKNSRVTEIKHML